MTDVEFENKFDRKACKKLVAEILAGDYDCDIWELVEMLLEYFRVQPRAKDDPKHVRSITHKIKNGSVKKCNPVVIFEKW